MLIPILYLKGISTGDFEEVLAAFSARMRRAFGVDHCPAQGGLDEEHERWQKRDLSVKRYVYVWADGIHLQARLEERPSASWCIIGATPEGKKELVGFTDGMRESANPGVNCCSISSAADWRAPELAVADGALGFWKALGEVWPKTREQRCWVHKTANVLNKLPKSLQAKAKRALQEIWMAETKKPPRPPSMPSPKPTASSTRRPSSA